METNSHNNAISHCRRALTLIELLVVIAIISILIAILVPALGASRGAARDLECKARMRGILTEFVAFADPTTGVPRGESEMFAGDVFRLEDFQEKLYGIDEFWSGPDENLQALNQSILVCPAAPGSLQIRPGVPCSDGAVTPVENVSTGFNKRLDESTETAYVAGIPVTVRSPVYLSSKILHQPDVPLVFDVDGQAAADLLVSPHYAAPPILTDKIVDMYESGRYWFPSTRHSNRINVGFIGGHVLSSRDPITEPFWRWGYKYE